MALDIALTAFLVFMNAFFVASEFAIVKVRASQIELKIREGNKVAELSKRIITHLDAYLSATQLGITLASLGLGWIGESVVARIIFDVMAFAGIPLTPELSHQVALPAAFIVITMLHIVFGELAPKSLAIQRTEGIALGISTPLHIFYLIFKPAIWLLNTSANHLIKLLGFDAVTEESHAHSTEELRYLLEESSKQGILAPNDHELMENVFEFSHTPIKQVMVPRGRIIGVELTMSNQQFIDRYLEEGFSRMPVYDKNIDNIVGIVYSKNIIDMLTRRNSTTLKDLIHPPYFVGEDEKIDVIFRHMQKNKLHMVIVLDEFGGTAGLATLEDIIEEIFGEIQDEDDEESPNVKQISDTEFTVRATATIADINDDLPEPLPESDDYETLGGMILNELDRIPEKGETVEIPGYSAEIIAASNLMIETVKLTKTENENKEKEDEDE